MQTTTAVPDPNARSLRRARLATWGLAGVALLAFVLPPSRLTAVWGTGFAGCNSAMFANFARSYHAAPAEIASYLPALHRAPGEPAAEKDIYASQFPYIYLAYAAATALIGTEEAALRLVSIVICLAGALLVARLAGRRDPWAGAAAVFLYLTAPVTLLYGHMAEIILPQGICLALALYAYGRRAGGRIGQGRYVLACLPLALSSSFLFPFYAVGVFAADLALRRRPWGTVKLLFTASLPWAGLLLVHLGIVQAVYGDLDVFFGRAGTRGLRLDRIGGDLAAVGRNWVERLGLPQLLLFLAAAGVRSVAALRRDPGASGVSGAADGFVRVDPTRPHERPPRPDPAAGEAAPAPEGAAALATLLAVLSTTVGLMGWFAVHRYGMQLWIPAAALMGGPLLADLLRGTAKRPVLARAAGVALAVVCVGLFAHRLRRYEGPNAYERALAGVAARAGAHARGDERPILLVVRKNVMGARMSVLYYGRHPEHRIRIGWLDRFDPIAYPAVIGLDVADRHAELRTACGAAPDDVLVRAPTAPGGAPLGSIFLWLNPEAESPPAGGTDAPARR